LVIVGNKGMSGAKHFLLVELRRRRAAALPALRRRLGERSVSSRANARSIAAPSISGIPHFYRMQGATACAGPGATAPLA